MAVVIDVAAAAAAAAVVVIVIAAVPHGNCGGELRERSQCSRGDHVVVVPAEVQAGEFKVPVPTFSAALEKKKSVRVCQY
ncbi:hypothetical protein SCUP234_13058 [Seiridium cupressi]